MSDALSILVIDGSDRDREYYTHLLAGCPSKYDVVQALTGRTGLDQCGRQPFDCVVLELDLPDMSGFEVLAKLVPRAYRPEIAVIVLTRLPNQFLLELAIKNGAQTAFHKTVGSGDHLEQSILKAITRVQALNKLVN